MQKKISARKLCFSVCFVGAVFVCVWCFWRCLSVFCGAVLHSLWCASMLPSVTFENAACVGVLLLVYRHTVLSLQDYRDMISLQD